MAENWARWCLKSGKPCVKHKPHSKMSSDGRMGRRGQTKKKTEYDGREAAPRVQAAHRRSCTGGKKVKTEGRRWSRTGWSDVASFTPAQTRTRSSERGDHRETSRGSEKTKGPWRGSKRESWPRWAWTEAENVSHCEGKEKRRGEEIWVQGDFRIWRTKLRIFAWKIADCVVWAAGRRLSVRRGGCWSLEERCEVTAPGTAEYTVCWVSSLVCKGNNMVLPHHHPRAEVQEINWQMCSELRLPRHVWCRETPTRRVVKKRSADRKLIKKGEVVLFFSVKFTSTKCYAESCQMHFRSAFTVENLLHTSEE